MSLENTSLWVKIFEGSLSDPNGFKITTESSPGLNISIDVFSPLYKIAATCPNSQPWWWLAGSLVERAGSSLALDFLEIGRYIIPREREILLRPRFTDVPFYYIFEPAYWHTQVDVTLWAWIGDENQTPKSTLEGQMLAISSRSVEGHLGAVNPHGITLALLGSASQSELDALAQEIEALQSQAISQADLEQITGMANAYTDTSFEEHLADINPHQLTPETIGAVRSSLFEGLEGEVEVLKNTPTVSEESVDSRIAKAFADYNQDFNPQLLTIPEVTARVEQYSDSARADHLAQDNPHAITPEMIGALSEQLQESTLAYGSGWQTFVSSGWGNPKAVKQGRIVCLQGMLQRVSSDPTLRLIAVLPAEFRPRVRQLFISWCAYSSENSPCRVDVDTNGNIFLMHPSPSAIVSWVSLFPISFVSA